MAGLHNVILFKTKDSIPFSYWHLLQGRTGDVGYRGGLGGTLCNMGKGYTCLYALSPDGQSAGMLNPEQFDFNMYLPPGGPPQLVENGFVTNHPAIQPVRLPKICNQDPASPEEQRCDRILFSPNGRYLAFRYGEDRCGRSLQVIDRRTGGVILEQDHGVHHILFLPNGKLSINAGHCEGSFTSFFDPLTRQTLSGGGVGQITWNQARSLFVEDEGDYVGSISILWGYRLDPGISFYPEGKRDQVYDEHPVFLPDDRRFLYQHLPIGMESGVSPVFDTPAQIVRYDPITGQRAVLASDPAYHYRLCQFDHENPCPLQWHGDWIQVQRVPFILVRPKGEVREMYSELSCLIEGRKCAAPPESFALNAVTGELRPWDPDSLPQPDPTPTPTPGPDLSAQPLYTDPSGLYALYVGADGNSLWMQPKEGPPMKWARGEDFFYLP